MTGQTEELLVSEEAIKTGRPTVFVDKLSGFSTLPRNALCPGKGSLEELGWGTEFYVNMAVAHTWGAASIIGTADSVNSIFGIFLCWKLNKAVHGLASGPFHDNVNWASLGGWEQVSVASKERGHLLASHGVRDLGIVTTR